MKIEQLSVVILLGVASYFANAQESPQQTKDEFLQFDCSTIRELGLAPGELFVQLYDNTPGRAAAGRLTRLQAPACKSVRGALRVVVADGKSAPWLNGLRFVLVTSVAGQTDQAALIRKPFTDGHRNYVEVAQGMFSAYSAAELTWVLGHELAHGVHHDADWKAGARASGNVVTLGGVLGGVARKGLKAKAVSLAIGAGGAATALCGPSYLTSKQEIAADIFGIRIITALGTPLADAKATAISTFKRHQEAGGDCISVNKPGVIDSNSHPSTDARISAIQRLK